MIEFVNEVKVDLIAANASDDMVALSAWVSHAADEVARLADRNAVEKLIRFLYINKHMSPFEHGQFILKADVPLFVAREWQRHRTKSYNEVSGRYTLMAPRFYVPPRERPLVQEGKPGNYTFVQGTNEQYAIAVTHIETNAKESWSRYEHMLEAGIAKEVARMVLPLNMMTQFYATVNPRNLMGFLTLRNEKHALYEIRQAAVEAETYLADAMPLSYKAYRTARDEEENPLVVINADQNTFNPPVVNIYTASPEDVERIASENNYFKEQLADLGYERYDGLS